MLLDDGYQTCSALKALEKEFSESKDGGFCWPENLVQVFESGLAVDYRCYGDCYEREVHIAFQTLRHDEAQNRFRPSSIYHKCMVVERFAAKVPGRDMTKVAQMILDVFGKSKKATVARWTRAFCNLHPDVLSFLKTYKTLPDSYVFDNPYMLGPGRARPQKLKAADAVKCLQLVRQAFHRVVMGLETLQGLREIVGCMQHNLPLHGVSETTGHMGIVECRTLFQEFKKAKDGKTDLPYSERAQGGHEHGSGDQDGGDDGTGQAVIIEAAAQAEVAPVEDPLQTEARAKVPATMLTAAAEMATRARLDTWSLAVLCGGRIDYMSSVQSKMMSLWPQSQVYVCLIGNGNDNQSCKRKSKFALVVHFGKHPANVPTTLAALRGKAKSFEGLRLRCLSLDCKHRSAGDQKSAAELAQQAISDPKVAATMDRSEIPPDDDEAKADPDEAMSEEECETFLDPLGQDGRKRDFIVDVFAFSKSTGYYETIFKQLLVSDTSVLAVILTSTTHPSSAVAARVLGQEVFVANTAASEHSVKHGVDLQDQIFRHRFLSEKGAAQQKRTISTCGIQLIEGPTLSLDQQLVRLTEVSVPSSDPWGGLDINHSCLDQRVPQLLTRELSDAGLGLQSQGSMGRGLITTRPLQEGERVIACTSAKFSSLDKLTSFLKLPGHAALADGVVAIYNVVLEEGRAPGTVFCVLLGAAYYVQHFTGIRSRPNVAFLPNPSAGMGSELLYLQVRTFNAQGIARSSPLVCSYGLGYDLAAKSFVEDGDDRVKRFRGALDEIFQRSLQHGDSGTTPSGPVPSTSPPSANPSPPSPRPARSPSPASGGSPAPRTGGSPAPTAPPETPAGPASGAPSPEPAKTPLPDLLPGEAGRGNSKGRPF
ncbi:unnamed protein product [Effrenium voratum]|nr:unnamed protein product [Effrenium voratum]